MHGQRSRLGEAFDDLEQAAHTATFLIEGISGNSGRHLITDECSAHGDQVNQGKVSSNELEEFEAGHTRHVEIGEDDIWDLPSDFNQCREPVFCRSNGKTNLIEFRWRDHAMMLTLAHLDVESARQWGGCAPGQ